MKRNLYLAAAGVVVLGAAVASVAVVETSQASKAVTAEVIDFTHSAPYKVTFQVDKPPGDTVVCDVGLVSFDYQLIGDVPNIVVGPSKTRSQRLQVTIPVKSGTPNQPQVIQCVHR